MAQTNESYTPTEWHDGDLITVERMNKIEEGIVNASATGGDGGVLCVDVDDNGVMQETYQTIYDAMSAGKMCISYIHSDGALTLCFIPFIGNGEVRLVTYNLQDSVSFFTNSPSDYPSTNEISSQ